MTKEEQIKLLNEAATTLHEIASSISARYILAETRGTSPMREYLSTQLMVDSKMREKAIDGFTKIAQVMRELGDPNVTEMACRESDMRASFNDWERGHMSSPTFVDLVNSGRIPSDKPNNPNSCEHGHAHWGQCKICNAAGFASGPIAEDFHVYQRRVLKQKGWIQEGDDRWHHPQFDEDTTHSLATAWTERDNTK